MTQWCHYRLCFFNHTIIGVVDDVSIVTTITDILKTTLAVKEILQVAVNRLLLLLPEPLRFSCLLE